MIFAIRQFIAANLGEEFVSAPAFNLSTSFADSDRYKPLILILAPGSDPLNAIQEFQPDDPKDRPVSVNFLSLGQGQGPAAQTAILEAAESGSWIVLQNCHLAIDWMPKLVMLWEDELLSMASGTVSVHRAFRMWLTSYATKNFPSQLLQAGVKVSLRYNVTIET